MATSPAMAMATKQATWGYSGVWAADDLEELVTTMTPASRWMVARPAGMPPRSRPLACGSGANDPEILGARAASPGRCAAP
jgi:hypothetical protein